MPEQRYSDPTALVEYIARSLVRHPKDVHVLPVKSPASLILELRVNKEDIGMIIGKGGRIAKAIRVLLNAISVKKIVLQDGREERYQKILLEIVDEA
jgi:predicted RNA-binding protein YlqC (UPF0109 family)